MFSEQELAIEKKLASLPKDVYDFIVDPEENDTSKIFNDAGLVLEQKRLIRRDIKKVYAGELPVASFYATIKSKLNLPEDKLNKFVADFIGYRFLPLDDFLGGQATTALMALKVNPNAYPPKRIIIRTVKPSEVVTEFLHDHPVNIPAFLEHRLREILESRVRGVRKDEETVLRLTRAEKIGGAEMELEEAKMLVEALSAKVASMNIDADVEIAKQPVPPPVEAKPLHASPNVVSPPPAPSAEAVAIARSLASAASRKGDTMSAADEHEANVIRDKVLPGLVTPNVFDLDKEVNVAVADFVVAFSLAAGTDGDRLKTIAVSRLRGVRDAAETKDLLSRPRNVGGMGLDATTTEKTAAYLQNRFNLINDRRQAAMQKEKDGFVKSEAMRYATKDEARKSGEQEDLDRLYGSLTGKAPTRPASPVAKSEISPSVGALSRATPVVSSSAVRIVPGTSVSPKSVPAAFVPLAPKSSPVPASSVSPAGLPTKQQTTPLPTPPGAAKTPTTPSQVVFPGPPPKMRDIRPTSQPVVRLTGPVEELRNFNLVDFRHLSADPVEACRKIIDKLDILEDHSYARRIEGAKAWQESPLNKMYLETIMASFSSGQPVSAIVGARQAQTADSLTEREVRAIMDLNKRLKA